MSHATVTVKVSASRLRKHNDDLDAALTELNTSNIAGPAHGCAQPFVERATTIPAPLT